MAKEYLVRTECAIVGALLLALPGSVFGQPVPEFTTNQPPAPLAAPANSGILYDQNNNCSADGVPSQDFTDAGGTMDAYDGQAADDFVVPAPGWVVLTVQVPGAYDSGPGPAESVNIFFYRDAGGLPGALEYSALALLPSAGLASGSFTVDLPTPAILRPGMHWVSVQSNQDGSTAGRWFWTLRNSQAGRPGAWRNPGDGWATGCTTWGTFLACAPDPIPPDLCFALLGAPAPNPAPALSAYGLAAGLLVLLGVGAFAFRRRRLA